jgi:hypothetical protein
MHKDDNNCKVNERLKGLHPVAIAIDPQKQCNRVYCEPGIIAFAKPIILFNFRKILL